MTGLFPDNPGAPIDMLALEAQALRRGYCRIAGIDEAGRGPLAGPVVAAAVVLPSGMLLPGVNDSKQLTEEKREELFDVIHREALAVGVGIGDHALVDSINILQATLSAMRDAVRALSLTPDFLLIDGISNVPMNIPQRTVKKGDSLSLSIAAASIIAKVTRDRMMVQYDVEYPGYGFASHKGYGAASHLAAITELGPCPIHRKTFSGVKEHLPPLPGSDTAGPSTGLFSF
ncbi:Ribonuclease HII [Citrifermentans bremense]|uniref:Ribonuclease HII n=2 Tax=Citrifermentans bremense TaxID=60035 RepID=A0A7R7FSK4_9BACT|nr:ribonuclease HII [Citrifermentans bremense]BCO11581.1 Ribonuclease HII [Citrifermentans bremense]